MNHFGRVLFILAVVAVGAIGCKKEESASAPAAPKAAPSEAPAGTVPTPTAKPATAPAPTTAVAQPDDGFDIAAILARGGKHWSSHEQSQYDGRTIKAGKDFWIWPADDVVHSPKDGTLAITLRWRLRPDGKPVTGGTVYAILESEWPDSRVNLRIPVTGFDGTTAAGKQMINFTGWKGSGTGEVGIHLSRPGDPAPLSNLLRVSVSAAK